MKTERLLELITHQLSHQLLCTNDQIERTVLVEAKNNIEQQRLQLLTMDYEEPAT